MAKPPIWMNLQNGYDKKLLQIEEEEHKDEIEIANMIDIAYFKRCNFLEQRSYKKDKFVEYSNHQDLMLKYEVDFKVSQS